PTRAADTPALDFPGATLLPGLVDVHVHLVASGGPDLAATLPKTEVDRTIAAVVNARRQLDQGVTLVRDLGAPGAEAIQVGRAVKEGTVAGPRVVAAGPAVTMTGGHIPYLGRVTDGVEAMRASVRANLAMGAQCIKVVATGGVLTPGVDPREPAYTQPELDALVSEAHRLGLTVAAHAIGEGGVAAALRAGVDSIEHGMFLDEAAIELFLRTGARLTPTFMAPHGILGGPSVPGWIKDRARPAAEAQARSFRAAVSAGVPAVAGTDAGTPDNPHGGGAAREAAFMVDAGLGVLAAVKAATGEAADLLGVADRGVLREGAAADVLVADGDAATDITALQRPLAVFQDGRRVV
ncbi:MAG TPA: amidohydrolase family protein, partial [Actinomycetota bacterium]|nr:amidohydrolase family protein [Actinomycetota bacterium]